MLDMCDSLQHRILENDIPISSQLFENLITQYAETQSWNKINALLSRCTHINCDPNQRMVSYLKKNLVYCFDTTTRNQLKYNIDRFEILFFSPEQREIRK